MTAALIECQHRSYPDTSKCPGCGWRTHEKYCALGLDIDEHGLCAECWQEVTADVEGALLNLRQLMCSGREPRISAAMFMRFVLQSRQLNQ